MAHTILSNEAGKWETVKGRKGDKKRKQNDSGAANPVAPKPIIPTPPPARTFSKASNTFDALFDTDEETAEAVSKKKGKSSTNDVQTPGTPPQSQEQNPSAFSPDEGKKGPKERKDKKEKKPKKKAGKKQTKTASDGKTTPEQSSGITSAKLKSILREAENKSPLDDVAQLKYIADALIIGFKDVSVGFPGDIQYKPYEETLEIADGFLSAGCTGDLVKFLSKKSIGSVTEAFSAFLQTLFDASEGVSSSKGQLGLLVLVSVIARSLPVASVHSMDELVYEGKRFTSPQRMPILLWVFGQAERGASGAFLACWMRIIVPQLIGSIQGGGGKKKKGRKQTFYRLDGKTSLQATQGLQRVLCGDGKNFKICPNVEAMGKTGLKYMDGGVEVYEPLISLPLYDQVLSILYGQTAVSNKIKKTLEGLHCSLREFAFSSSNSTALHEFVQVTLAFAGKSEGDYLGHGDETVEVAAKNLITCLAADPECFEVWTISHNKHIKGSCRILQHLLYKPPREFLNHIKNSTNRAAFMATMRKIQERHGFLLADGRGWQAACAKGAHEATKKFLDGSGLSAKSSIRIPTAAVFSLIVMTGLGTAVVMAKWDEIVDLVSSIDTSSSWEKLESLLGSDIVQNIRSSLESAASYLSGKF